VKEMRRETVETTRDSWLVIRLFSLINNDTFEKFIFLKETNKQNFFIRLAKKKTIENCKKNCLPVCGFEWNQFYAHNRVLIHEVSKRRKMETLEGIKKGWRERHEKKYVEGDLKTRKRKNRKVEEIRPFFSYVS
jgi:hypothetical protein